MIQFKQYDQTNRPTYQPGDRGWDLDRQAKIWALRLGFGPRDWDLGLETGIWAWGGCKKMMEKEEKNPHMCERIGHRALRGRCPASPLTSHNLLRQGTGTPDYLTLLWLFILFLCAIFSDWIKTVRPNRRTDRLDLKLHWKEKVACVRLKIWVTQRQEMKF